MGKRLAAPGEADAVDVDIQTLFRPHKIKNADVSVSASVAQEAFAVRPRPPIIYLKSAEKQYRPIRFSQCFICSSFNRYNWTVSERM